MPITTKDMKLLWGNAGGHCSNPGCRRKLSETGVGGEQYILGEQAHIIAKQVHGPRGQEAGGDDTYDNLVLLCPTCHTMIDKAPEGTYPEDKLLEWKAEHEAWVDGWSKPGKVAGTQELMKLIAEILHDNLHYFSSYGPTSDHAKKNPVSSAQKIWAARKLDTIIPNNRKILQALEANKGFIPDEMKDPVRRFRDHVTCFEANQYERMDAYQLFPQEFSQFVKKWSEA